MTGSQPPTVPVEDRGTRWPTTMASLCVGGAFFALWFWLLPDWLGFHVETTSAARWRWIAAIPSILGFAVALRCIWDFGSTGHGTPAPIAPPTRLVVVGFYRYVRNPMYLGFFGGVAWALGGLRTREWNGARSRGGHDLGHRAVCPALRGTNPTQDVRSGVRGVLQKRTPLDTTPPPMAKDLARLALFASR